MSKVSLIEQIAELNLRAIEIADTIAAVRRNKKADPSHLALANIRESRLQKIKAAAKTLEWLHDNEQTIRDAVQGRAA